MNSRWDENLIIFEWRWFQLVLTAGSKLGFLGQPEIDFGSNLVKVVKNIREAGFDVKP